MTVNANYITNVAGNAVMSLPAVFAVGDIIRLTNQNAGGTFRVRQTAGVTIFFDQAATTPGIAGYVQVTNAGARASIELVCVTANTNWNVLSSIGAFTVV